jgi:predicted aspartyl protease
MIIGRVTAQHEAVARLVILDMAHQPHDIDAVLDTEFNGFLTLPRALVQTLQLPLAGNRRVTLGDGSTVVLDLYLATVLWDTQPREVLVLAAEGGPLMGMAMLYGHRVILHVVDNGDVLIEPWP